MQRYHPGILVTGTVQPSESTAELCKFALIMLLLFLVIGTGKAGCTPKLGLVKLLTSLFPSCLASFFFSFFFFFFFFFFLIQVSSKVAPPATVTFKEADAMHGISPKTILRTAIKGDTLDAVNFVTGEGLGVGLGSEDSVLEFVSQCFTGDCYTKPSLHPHKPTPPPSPKTELVSERILGAAIVPVVAPLRRLMSALTEGGDENVDAGAVGDVDVIDDVDASEVTVSKANQNAASSSTNAPAPSVIVDYGMGGSSIRSRSSSGSWDSATGLGFAAGLPTGTYVGKRFVQPNEKFCKYLLVLG
jgi:hypothetical protein